MNNNRRIVETDKISRPGTDSPLIAGHMRVRVPDDSPSPVTRMNSPDPSPRVRLNLYYSSSPSRNRSNSYGFDSSIRVPELNGGESIINGIQPRVRVTSYVNIPPMVTPPRVTPGSISSDPSPITGVANRLPPGRLNTLGELDHYYREQTLFDIKQLRNEKSSTEEVIETLGTNEQISILDQAFEGFVALVDSFT